MADDSLLSRCEVVARILIRSSHSHESHNIPPCIIRLYWSTCQLINKHHHLLLPLHQLHLGRCHLISAMGEITPQKHRFGQVHGEINYYFSLLLFMYPYPQNCTSKLFRQKSETDYYILNIFYPPPSHRNQMTTPFYIGYQITFILIIP